MNRNDVTHKATRASLSSRASLTGGKARGFGSQREITINSEANFWKMWKQFDDGRSISTRGKESGIIIRDEEHSIGARITLERGGYHPFAITCGIYGWMFHTVFFTTESEAQNTFDGMKVAIEQILCLIPLADDPDVTTKMDAVSNAISDFVSQF